MKTVKLTIDGKAAEVFEKTTCYKVLGITELERIGKLDSRDDEGGDKE